MKVTEYLSRCILQRADSEANAALTNFKEKYGHAYLESLGDRMMTPSEKRSFESSKQNAVYLLMRDEYRPYVKRRVAQLTEWVQQLPDAPPDWIVDETLPPPDPKKARQPSLDKFLRPHLWH